jgi:hypothetical protein
MKKRIASLAMALLLAFALVPDGAIFANDTINVTIDGAPVSFEGQPPVIVDGRTLVPVRGVFEMLGFEVNWNNDTRQATLSSADYTVVLTVGSATFTTNGASHTLDVPAQLIGGRTMVPIRLPLEAVGFNVGWDNVTRTVLITSSGTAPTPAPTPVPLEFGLGTFTPITGWDMMSELGMGINIGDTLDARVLMLGDWAVEWVQNPVNRIRSEIVSGETRIEPWHFQAVASMGFDHVRIPVCWEHQIDANGRIYQDWLDRVQEVVDQALSAGLYVVITNHWSTATDDSLYQLIGTNRMTEAEAWITNLWTQIATRFKDYPETLLFEPLNEPSRIFSRRGDIVIGSIFTERDGIDTELTARINRMNNVVLGAIRDTGGFNDRRVVVNVSAAALPVSIPHYEHPDDQYTMLGLMVFPVDSYDSVTLIRDGLARGIPIWVKEIAPIFHNQYQDYSQGNVSERDAVAWIRETFTALSEMGVPFAYWNHEEHSWEVDGVSHHNRGWQIWSRTTGVWNTALVNALFTANGRTPGTIISAPPLQFPLELTEFVIYDEHWRAFVDLHRIVYDSLTVLTFHAADRIVIEHTGGTLPRFTIATIIDGEFISYHQDNRRITEEPGRIIFDLRGINNASTVQMYLGNYPEPWRDDWATITRVYLQ